MITVAENLTVTDPRVQRGVAERDARLIASVARECAKADFLDVNLGPGSRDSADRLEFVLSALEGVWEGGIFIDSTDAKVMEMAAKGWRGPVVLNGYAGGGGREGVLEVAARLGLPLVVFLMDKTVPSGVEERLALLATLVGNCQNAGIPLERIIVDPVVAPMGWMDGQARNAGLLEVLRQMPHLFGEQLQSIVGLSNLATRSTGGKSAAFMMDVFLAMTAGAGLTHVMLDARSETLLRTAKAISVLKGERAFAPGEF
jgi:5-methyltetrahydrofolate corrinoid/iron sulfur protein methyltransferase